MKATLRSSSNSGQHTRTTATKDTGKRQASTGAVSASQDAAIRAAMNLAQRAAQKPTNNLLEKIRDIINGMTPEARRKLRDLLKEAFGSPSLGRI